MIWFGLHGNCSGYFLFFFDSESTRGGAAHHVLRRRDFEELFVTLSVCAAMGVERERDKTFVSLTSQKFSNPLV